jgi:hypothetical protein
MSLTGVGLIESAMRLINVLYTGESASTQEKTDILEALNLMLSSLYTENYFLPQENEMSWAVDSTYTAPASIGTDPSPSSEYGGPHIAQVRPMSINYAWVRDSGGLDSPLDLISWKDYDFHYGNKSSSGRPGILSFKPGWVTGYITLYPTPDTNYTVFISTLQSFSFITDATLALGYPTEYLEALKYLLALRIAPEFGKPINPFIVQEANRLKGNMKRLQQNVSSRTVFELKNRRRNGVSRAGFFGGL